MARSVQIVTAVLALVLVAVGLWALLAPHAFYENAAHYPPYNEHFVHDIGAFALGLGVCLLAAVALRDGLLAALLGATGFAVAHAFAHTAVRDAGGNASDPVTFGVLAVVFVLLVVGRAAGRRQAG